MKALDTVIISHSAIQFAGKIGFIIEVRQDAPNEEIRVDVQFPFDTYADKKDTTSRIFQQCSYELKEVTLLQSH